MALLGHSIVLAGLCPPPLPIPSLFDGLYDPDALRFLSGKYDADAQFSLVIGQVQKKKSIGIRNPLGMEGSRSCRVPFMMDMSLLGGIT